MSHEKVDLYQDVTDRIVTAIESGTMPWIKPWASEDCAQKNAITGRAYSGVNSLLLGISGFASPSWLTYKQAQAVGANVRKGEKGTRIVFFKAFKLEDKNSDESAQKIIPILRCFTVFNTAQVDGLPEKYIAPIVKREVDYTATNEQAEAALSMARVEHGGATACFIPSMDKICLPHKADFRTTPEYYAIAMHELTHWTGHESRLKREFGKRFGDKAYAFEELVAELGAAFLCSRFGIDGELQHDAYISSWLDVLKSDKRAIFTASSAAKKAAEFVAGPIVEIGESDEEKAA